MLRITLPLFFFGSDQSFITKKKMVLACDMYTNEVCLVGINFNTKPYLDIPNHDILKLVST